MNVPRILLPACIIAACIFLNGCASDGAAGGTPFPHQPKPNMGLVVIYRKSTSLMREGIIGRALGFRHVRDNGTDLGRITNGTFMLYDAQPGPHQFTSGTETQTACNVQVEPNKTYFVRGSIHTGVVIERVKLEEVDAATGTKEARRLEKAP